MRENKNVCQKGTIGSDNNPNDQFGRDEQDATPHRNPVHPVNPVKNIV